LSLRLRLTLTYVGLLIPALLVFGVISYLIAASRIYGTLDDSLLAQIEGVQSALSSNTSLSNNEIQGHLKAIDAASISDFEFKMISTDAETLFASSRSALFNLPDPKDLSVGQDQPITRGKGGAQARIVFEPVADSSGRLLGYIVGGISFRQTDAAIDALRGVFLIGGALVVVLTAAPAYVLAGRALKPIRDVSSLAARIERTGNFDSSLALPGTKGETVELVRTFNAMIELVKNMLLGQKAFLAESAHELRRPLTVIRTYIDILGDPNLPEDERTSALAAMQEEADAMSGLLTDLLMISRDSQRPLERVEVDITHLCERLQRQISGQDSPRNFAMNVDSTLDCVVLGDPDQLERMISNLLQNAAQNTPPSGEIRLRVENQDSNVRIVVEDEGFGISPEDQPHVFERFFRGQQAQRSRAEGVGLGLTIVKHIAESHGGKVWLQSKEGEGSAFFIELPLARQEARLIRS
jgi:two-component system, OmpR family, sensor kinase